MGARVALEPATCFWSPQPACFLTMLPYQLNMQAIPAWLIW